MSLSSSPLDQGRSPSSPERDRSASKRLVPPIFVSHGSPMIALEPRETGAFLARLGPAIDATFGRPRAILAVSAHTAARSPLLLAGERHEALHDFGRGFDPRLFAMRYDAPGARWLASRVQGLLAAQGVAVQRVDEGGLDHGIWTVLRYMVPAAGLPVLPLAFVPDQPPAAQWALGAALAPLAEEGVLILGTGSITHNLRLALAGGLRDQPLRPERAESAAFRRWFAEKAAAGDRAALVDYRRQAPHAVEMHPTDEHLLPWFVAAGAGDGHPAVRLHASVTYGSLGMDAYAFGPAAAGLAVALAPASAEVADAPADRRPAASPPLGDRAEGR